MSDRKKYIMYSINQYEQFRHNYMQILLIRIGLTWQFSKY